MNVPSHGYNVNMIATPPPAEPQYITVSAILFAPEEGMQDPMAYPRPVFFNSPKRRTTTDHLHKLSTVAQTITGHVSNTPGPDTFSRRPG